MTMDVKTAFLNAELVEEEEEENDYVIIKPSHVLVAQGYFSPQAGSWRSRPCMDYDGRQGSEEKRGTENSEPWRFSWRMASRCS